MTPQGRASRRNAFSSSESAVPERPQIKACEATLCLERSYWVTKQLPPAVFSDFADLDCLVARSPGADADTIVDALRPEVGFLDDGV